MIIQSFRALRRDTTEVFDQERWIYTFFIEAETGRRILITHGTEYGIWPQASNDAIDRHQPEMIYCCHPKIMKRLTGDLRIQGSYDGNINQMVVKHPRSEYVYITVENVLK